MATRANILDQPKVSVVMTVMNEMEYIHLSIESILNQSLTDFEFIIVDDGSTDATPEILANYALRDARIRILTNTTNLSVPKSANRGMSDARGKYIARMDADDIAMPNRLSTQVKFLDENLDFVLVGTGHEFIDSQGAVVSTHPHGAPPIEFDWNSIFRPPLIQSSAMFRNDTIKSKCVYYDHEFNRAADFEFWHRLLKHGKGCELPGIYVQYRTHNRNVSTKFAFKQHEVWRKAAILNTKNRFPAIEDSLLDATFSFFQATACPSPTTIKNTRLGLHKITEAFAEQNCLASNQKRKIHNLVARSLLTEAARAGVFENVKSTLSFAKNTKKYFWAYGTEAICAFSRRLSNRRSLRPRTHSNINTEKIAAGH